MTNMTNRAVELRASGVERDPGEMTASATPAAANPAIMACDQAKLREPVSAIIEQQFTKKPIVVAPSGSDHGAAP